MRQLEDGGPSIHLSCLVVDTADADPHAYEPIYADGALVSYVMAGGYGHVVEVDRLAYLPTELAEVGTGSRVRDPPARSVRPTRPARRSSLPNERLLSFSATARNQPHVTPLAALRCPVPAAGRRSACSRAPLCVVYVIRQDSG